MLTVAEVEAFAERVKQALAGAEADRRTVEALRTLVASGGTVRSGRRAAGGAGAVRNGGHASDDRILDFVRASKEGVRVGDLIQSLRMNRKALTRALKRLRDSGAVRMTGEKRLARYHAV